MPPISEHFDPLLTRWITRGSDLRKEIVFQKDLIEPLALAASGNRLTLREKRRRDLQHLAQTTEESRARWDERLHRIEEWKNSVSDLQQQGRQLHQLLGSMVWLQKAHTHLDAFVRRLEQRADLLGAEQQALHQKMMSWLEILQERVQQLEELKQKETTSGEPLYVSRARKQPELDFVNEQRAMNETLGKEMQQLRRSLTLTFSRLHKALNTLEERAGGNQILFEIHKQEIESALKGAERVWLELREQILTDALLFESCRSALRRIQDIVRGLRYVEDISRNEKSGWKKFFLIR